MKLNKLFSILVPLTLSSAAMAGQMTNNVSGLYNKTLVPTTEEPVLCVKDANGNFVEWQYGQQLNPTQVSGNQYYWGAAIRSGGCEYSDIYYGWIDVSDGQVAYEPVAGSHIQLVNSQVTNNNISGSLGYTPIGVATGSDFPTNPSQTSPDNTNWFSGVNLSGFEFSTMPNASVIPNLSEADKNTDLSDLTETAHFLNEGANTVRLPIRWAYIKPEGPESTTPFDTSYFDSLYIPALETITLHGYYAIIDLHSYMHYSTVGNQVAGCGGPDGYCPDGTLNTSINDYVSTWSQIWQQIKKQPNVKADKLFFDVVNEPSTKTGETLTPKQAFVMQVAVIKQLQQEGFPGYFMVEGVSWTGLHSWEDSGNAQQFTRANFEKAGITDLSKIIINVHQYLDSDYSGTHDNCLQDLNTTGPNGFNLNAFVQYLQDNKLKAMVTEFGVGRDQNSCSQPFNDFLTYLNGNAYTPEKGYGFLGWTAWSTGHGWGDYNLRIQPNDWKDNILAPYFSQPN
jgi:endoglucanase